MYSATKRRQPWWIERTYVHTYPQDLSLTNLKKCVSSCKTCVGVFHVYQAPGPLFEIIKFLLKETSISKGNLHLPETFSTHGKRDLPVLKLNLYRPEQALKGPWFEAVRLSRQLAHAGGKVFSPTYQPSLPHHEINLVIISVREWVQIRAIFLPERLRE